MMIFLVLFFLNSVFHVMPFGSRIIIKHTGLAEKAFNYTCNYAFSTH